MRVPRKDSEDKIKRQIFTSYLFRKKERKDRRKLSLLRHKQGQTQKTDKIFSVLFVSIFAFCAVKCLSLFEGKFPRKFSALQENKKQENPTEKRMKKKYLMEFFVWWKILLSLWKIFGAKFEYKTNTTKLRDRSKTRERKKEKKINFVN